MVNSYPLSKDAMKQILGSIDTRLFGENAISTKLLKSYIFMGILVFISPSLLDAIFSAIGLEMVFFYLSMPLLVYLIIIFFIFHSIKQFLRPIRKLLAAVRKIEVGDLDVKLNLRGYLEIERLGNAVDRMRNSLMIARNYLGERTSVKDRAILDAPMEFHLTFILFLSYILYGTTVIAIAGVLYSPIAREQLAFLPHHNILISGIVMLAGLSLAIGIGYLMSVFIGTPMRRLTMAADEASIGNFDADFNVRIKGELNEIACHLASITEATKSAYAELEQGGGD